MGAANLAAAGSVLSLYATGEGQTLPAVMGLLSSRCCDWARSG